MWVRFHCILYYLQVGLQIMAHKYESEFSLVDLVELEVVVLPGR